MAKTVLILGTHRSGTSVVSGMFHALGVNMGPPGADDRWIYPNFANPTGQYENPEFTELLHQFMDFDGGEPRWDPRWSNKEWIDARWARYEPEFVRLVRRTESDFWGWKQAWSMLVLDRLMPSLKGPVFVVVKRDLEQIVDSIHRRDGLTHAEAEEVTREIWSRVDDLLTKYPGVPTLRFELDDILKDPGAQVLRMTQFLGLQPIPERVDRATRLPLKGAELRRAIRRYAVRDLVTLPSRYGWLLSKDLREHSRFAARHLVRTAPRELHRILRAAV